MVCTSVPGCLLTCMDTLAVQRSSSQTSLKYLLVFLSEHTVDHTRYVLLNQNNKQKQAKTTQQSSRVGDYSLCSCVALQRVILFIVKIKNIYSRSFKERMRA